MWFRSETPRARVLFCRHTNKIGARQARKWVVNWGRGGMCIIVVPAAPVAALPYEIGVLF